jgi:hypothetical protein
MVRNVDEWYYNHAIFNLMDEELKTYVGFVYCVTELATNKKYIGKKLFWASKTLPVTKTRKKKTKIKIQSDWKTYCGSSEEVKRLVESGSEFKREILRLCTSKGECSYFEAKMQFENDVLLREDYFNSFIGCKIHAKHLKL